MNSKISFLIITIFVSNIAFSQVTLNFIEKDAIDLPGNDILDLRIQDVNNDSFPDYVYMDEDSIYIVDGITINKIASIAKIPILKAFNIGDVNSDGNVDIAMAGYYADNSDTNFVKLIMGPDYTTDFTYKYPGSIGDWWQRPSDVFISNIFGQDLILLGIKKTWSALNSPCQHNSKIRGALHILYLDNGQIVLSNNLSMNGMVERMSHIIGSDFEYVIFTAFGEDFCANPYWGEFEWYNWTDIMLFYGFGAYSVWHTTGDSDYYTDLGHVRNMVVRQPQIGDFHVYFFNFSNTDPHGSIVCREIPDINGHNWQIPDNWPGYFNEKIAITDITGDGQDDAFIFNPVEIRDAFTGDLVNTGLAIGQRGQYLTELDQENDGIDEFFFKSSDSLYIFNLQIPSGVDDEVKNIPAEISISNNYPNPFNAITSFQIGVEKKVSLKIEIFDILGRKVLLDRNSALSAGKHNIRLDCQDLISGIYFARFSSPDFSTTRKINLIK